MKSLLRAAGVTSLAVLPTLALAQTSDLSVTGIIRPALCTPTLADGGNVNYGSINAATLDAVEPNQLGSRTISLTMDCTAVTNAGFTITDNRSASAVPGNTPTITAGYADDTDVTSVANPDDFYGLGTATNSAPIGNFVLAVTTSTLDSDTKDVISSTDDGATWAANAVGSTGGGVLVAFADVGTTVPVGFSNATIDLKVTAAVDDMTELNGSVDNILLDGNVTLTIVYL